MRFLILLLAAMVLLVECRKAEDIGNAMQPAINNATAFQGFAAHAFLPTAEVLRDWANSRSAVPMLLLTDSGIWFDYKTGVVCPDGLTRKGKCLIKNGFGFSGSEDTCWLSASPADSFAVFGNKGAVYFSGTLSLKVLSAYTVEVLGYGEICNRDAVYPFEMDGIITLDPEGQTQRSAKMKCIWNADFQITGQELYHYNVVRDKNCFPSFSLGNGHSTSREILINFNPLGNSGCDPLVKFTSGRDEWLGDLW